MLQRFPLRPADFDGAVQRHRDGNAGQNRGHVVRGDRLKIDRRQTNGSIDRAGIGDCAHEFEELSGAHDGVRYRSVLNRCLLRDFRRHIRVARHALRAHHRKCDVMLDARGRFGVEQIVRRGQEEFHHRRRFPRRRVRYVNHHRRALQRRGQPFAGEGVDSRFG